MGAPARRHPGGEAPEGRPRPRGPLQRPGGCLATRHAPSRGLASVGHADAAAAAGAPAAVAGPRPALRGPPGGAGERPAPPYAAGLGALLGGGRRLPRLGLPQRLGGKEGAAASDAGAAAPGRGRAAGAAAGAGGPWAVVAPLAGAAAAAKRAPRGRGPRTLPRQQAGKRRAGKPPAAFDVAGAGNVAMGALCTPRAIARARLATLHLKGARQFSTLPEGAGEW